MTGFQNADDDSLDGPHLLHPFLRRSSLIQDLESIYADVESRKGSQLFRIFMVFAIGAISLNRQSLHDTSPIDYYAAALENTGHMVGLSNMEHIQAILLIMLFSLQHDIGSESCNAL